MARIFTYLKGTFKVLGHNSFVYTRNRYKIYNHSVNMWDDKIHWEQIKKLFKGRGGSVKGAQDILDGLNFLATATPDELTTDELNMIQSILGATKTSGLDSFLSFYGRGILGKPFEERIGLLVASIFNEPLDDILYGERLTSAGGAITVVTDTTGKSKLGAGFGQAVLNDLGPIYKSLVKKTTTNIISGFGTKKTKIVVRQSTESGKIDINVPSEIKIQVTLSEEVEKMANAMKGHTFSLKNYSIESLTNFGIHLGHTTDFRTFSSFYYGATKDNNFANVCTFIFSSMESSNPTVKRYMDWARYIFELSGLGLYDINSNATSAPVDYLIVNARNVEGGIQVVWVGELVANAPTGELDGISFSKGNRVSMSYSRLL